MIAYSTLRSNGDFISDMIRISLIPVFDEPGKLELKTLTYYLFRGGKCPRSSSGGESRTERMGDLQKHLLRRARQGMAATLIPVPGRWAVKMGIMHSRKFICERLSSFAPITMAKRADGLPKSNESSDS